MLESQEQNVKKLSENQQDVCKVQMWYILENDAHTHFSLDVHGDTQKQRQIEAHL